MSRIFEQVPHFAKQRQQVPLYTEPSVIESCSRMIQLGKEVIESPATEQRTVIVELPCGTYWGQYHSMDNGVFDISLHDGRRYLWRKTTERNEWVIRDHRIRLADTTSLDMLVLPFNGSIAEPFKISANTGEGATFIGIKNFFGSSFGYGESHQDLLCTGATITAITHSKPRNVTYGGHPPELSGEVLPETGNYVLGPARVYTEVDLSEQGKWFVTKLGNRVQFNKMTGLKHEKCPISAYSVSLDVPHGCLQVTGGFTAEGTPTVCYTVNSQSYVTTKYSNGTQLTAKVGLQGEYYALRVTGDVVTPLVDEDWRTVKTAAIIKKVSQ